MAIILNRLKDQLPVASHLASRQNGEFCCILTTKPLWCHQNSGGHRKATTPDMCRQMGEALAVLHQTLQTLTLHKTMALNYILASGA